MLLKRRAFLEAAGGVLLSAAARAQTPQAPGNLLADGGGAIGGGNSTLAQQAAGLLAGRRTSLTAASQDAVLGSQSGSSGSLTHFGNGVTWNSISQSIEIIGADHLGGLPNWKKHVRYVAATNSFLVAQGQGALPNIGHCYDHTAVNPFNGDLYH